MRRVLLSLAAFPMLLGVLGLVVGKLTNDDMTGEALAMLGVGLVALTAGWFLT
jgi:hypothetical protein